MNNGSLKVKICGLTKGEDAIAACNLGADILGFNFVPGSSRYLNPYAAREMIRSLPPFISKVGIFANEDSEVINELVGFLGLDAVQLHGDEDERFCMGIKTPVIKALRVGCAEDLIGHSGYDVSAFLLDARVEGELGGTGRTFDWRIAVGFAKNNRIFVAGGLTPDNVGEAVRMLEPFGVDTASGVESEPGVKDHDLMEEFIRAARSAAAGNGGETNDIAC